VCRHSILNRLQDIACFRLGRRSLIRAYKAWRREPPDFRNRLFEKAESSRKIAEIATEMTKNHEKTAYQSTRMLSLPNDFGAATKKIRPFRCPPEPAKSSQYKVFCLDLWALIGGNSLKRENFLNLLGYCLGPGLRKRRRFRSRLHHPPSSPYLWRYFPRITEKPARAALFEIFGRGETHFPVGKAGFAVVVVPASNRYSFFPLVLGPLGALLIVAAVSAFRPGLGIRASILDSHPGARNDTADTALRLLSDPDRTRTEKNQAKLCAPPCALRIHCACRPAVAS
jgi:hypothetical protein